MLHYSALPYLIAFAAIVFVFHSMMRHTESMERFRDSTCLRQRSEQKSTSVLTAVIGL